MPAELRLISKLKAALALMLMSAGCDRSGRTQDTDRVPSEAVQRSDTALVDPRRYLRLSDLAAAIRKSGHPCEVVRSYQQIQLNDQGSAAYKIDCLEYSFRLTMVNGQSRIERFTSAPATEKPFGDEE